MAKHTRQSDELLRVVFENDRNEVSAELLIGSLMHTSSILHAINRELGEEKEIDIKIKAFEQGSRMLVDLEEIRSYDPELGEFVLGRDSYHVQRFKRHLPAARSSNLFEED